jgi:hypothetical protein
MAERGVEGGQWENGEELQLKLRDVKDFQIHTHTCVHSFVHVDLQSRVCIN